MQRLRQAGSAQKLRGNCSSSCVEGTSRHRQRSPYCAAGIASYSLHVQGKWTAAECW